MKNKKIVIILVLFAYILTACAAQEEPVKGSLAPNFEAQTLHGEEVSLEALQGKPIMLNFWATWCAPCRLEMLAIQGKYDLYSGELEILAINFDEPKEIVEAFEIELELSFDIVMDPAAKIQNLYQVRGYPTSIFIDSKGIIQNIHIGILTQPQLDQYLSVIGIGN